MVLTIKHVRRPLLPTGRASRVAVVVPCFNYARYLPASVGSALDQDGVDVRVVVVDDASTDDSLEVARSLAAVDERVTVLANSINRGPVDTFNAGLALADGEFLVRLDADDILTPGALARGAALLRAEPTVSLVYGRALHFPDGADLPLPTTVVRSWTVWSGRSWLYRRCRQGVNCITAPEAMVRTATARSIGGQRRISHSHDMEMWFRLASTGDVAHLDGVDQAWHREHRASLSASGSNVLTDLRERRQAFIVLLDGDDSGPGIAGDLPDGGGDLLRRLALRTLAEEALARAAHGLVRPGRGDADLNGLVAFATETVPDVSALRGWRALQRRQIAGASVAPYFPPFVAVAMARKLAAVYRHRRWIRTGL